MGQVHSTVGCFPTPQNLVMLLAHSGARVPKFLLPPGHPEHIPPHIVAYCTFLDLHNYGDENVSKDSQATKGDDDQAIFDPYADIVKKGYSLGLLHGTTETRTTAKFPSPIALAVSFCKRDGQKAYSSYAVRCLQIDQYFFFYLSFPFSYLRSIF